MEYIAYIHRVHRVQMFFDVRDTILRPSEPDTVYIVHNVHIITKSTKRIYIIHIHTIN